MSTQSEFSYLKKILGALRYAAPVLGFLGCSGTVLGDMAVRPESEPFSFVVAADMRSFVGPAPAGKRYFDGACEAMKSVGAGAFMLGPGDCDPPGPVRATIDRYLGTNYPWFPVTGNHELGKAVNMRWLREWSAAGIPHLVRHGPNGCEQTTYSFDFGDSHFVMLNEYFDGRSDTAKADELPESLLNWLEEDLQANKKPFAWVAGHKPLQSFPDMDSGRVRHGKETVSSDPARLERFLQLLQKHNVRAYICGHTHNTSVAKVKGIWQADSGHARGAGDTGSPSTFLKFRTSESKAWVDVYRSDKTGASYSLRNTVELN